MAIDALGVLAWQMTRLSSILELDSPYLRSACQEMGDFGEELTDSLLNNLGLAMWEITSSIAVHVLYDRAVARVIRFLVTLPHSR